MRRRDGSLRYLVVEDSLGRVGIAGAEAAESPVTRWGNRETFVEMNGMDAPLMEYGVQMSRAHGGENARGYQSNWNYVRETPLVQAYYRERGQAVPAPVPESLTWRRGRVAQVLGRLSPDDARAVHSLIDHERPLAGGNEVRARVEAERFIAREGADGARFIRQLEGRLGSDHVRRMFAEQGSDRIRRHRNQLTPERIETWARTPADQRSSRIRAAFEAFDGPDSIRGPTRPVLDDVPTGVRQTVGWSGIPTETPVAGASHLAVIHRGQARMSPQLRAKLDYHVQRTTEGAPNLVQNRERWVAEQNRWAQEEGRLVGMDPTRRPADYAARLAEATRRREQAGVELGRAIEVLDIQRDQDRTKAVALMRDYRASLMVRSEAEARTMAEKLNIDPSAVGQRDLILRAATDFFRMVDAPIDPSKIRVVDSGDSRGHALPVGRLDIGPGTRGRVMHELGHFAEWARPELYQANIEWRTARGITDDTGALQRSPLRSLTDSDEYGPGEIAVEDHFVSPYIGRDYAGTPTPKSTEVFTTGIEAFANPGDMLRLYMGDPEQFFLVTGALQP